jgi:hypothetical protein
VSTPLCIEGTGPIGPGRTLNAGRAAGLAGSVLLHGLVLLAFFVAGQRGLQASRGGAEFIPVEVVQVGNGVKALAPSGGSAQPQHQAAQQSQADPAQTGDASSATQTPADEPKADAFEEKLQALAKLRQPEQGDSSGAAMPAMDDGAAFGLDDMYQVRDFLRAQVERRWHLDLARLGNNHVSVPIRVEIASSGRVIKAEIVSSAHPSDPVYDEIAVSARNAVLLASPFSLPAGHYRDVMEVVLYLDPRDALR